MALKRITGLRLAVGSIVFFPLLTILLVLRFGIIEVYEVGSSSMGPTLLEGDRVLLKPVEHYEAKRGDIVVIERFGRSTTPLTKRVIAIPGDRITLTDGRLSINGAEPDEPFVIEPNRKIRVENTKIEVPAGHVFVLGDNRNFSFDSLDFGAVPIKQIRGRLFRIYWPPRRFGPVE